MQNNRRFSKPNAIIIITLVQQLPRPKIIPTNTKLLDGMCVSASIGWCRTHNNILSLFMRCVYTVRGERERERKRERERERGREKEREREMCQITTLPSQQSKYRTQHINRSALLSEKHAGARVIELSFSFLHEQSWASLPPLGLSFLVFSGHAWTAALWLSIRLFLMSQVLSFIISSPLKKSLSWPDLVFYKLVLNFMLADPAILSGSPTCATLTPLWNHYNYWSAPLLDDFQPRGPFLVRTKYLLRPPHPALWTEHTQICQLSANWLPVTICRCHALDVVEQGWSSPPVQQEAGGALLDHQPDRRHCWAGLAMLHLSSICNTVRPGPHVWLQQRCWVSFIKQKSNRKSQFGASVANMMILGKQDWWTCSF